MLYLSRFRPTFWLLMSFTLLVLLKVSSIASAQSARLDVLKGIKLSEHDSMLVVSDSNQILKSWQIDKPLIPASLTKLATAHLAIKKWGVVHRFHTDFFIHDDALWVKGYGDPYLVSEELDLLLPKLIAALESQLSERNGSSSVNGRLMIRSINIDNSYFDIKHVPGRSKVADPYNAPISAVSANFNSASLSKQGGRLASAEAQTPLTPTAQRMAVSMQKTKERVNLQTAKNAQLNFAELLLAKLKLLSSSSNSSSHIKYLSDVFDLESVKINVEQALPEQAALVYRHRNSHDLADVLRGTLEYSNNFIANQVFLALADRESSTAVSFESAREYAESELGAEFSWLGHALEEGSGLSRVNQLSAQQIDDLLLALRGNKTLFKKIKVTQPNVDVYAKTGTLNGVRSYAGYIDVLASDKRAAQSYRFVFNFNRKVPYRYRDSVLKMLLDDLIALPADIS